MSSSRLSITRGVNYVVCHRNHQLPATLCPTLITLILFRQRKRLSTLFTHNPNKLIVQVAKGKKLRKMFSGFLFSFLRLKNSFSYFLFLILKLQKIISKFLFLFSKLERKNEFQIYLSLLETGDNLKCCLKKRFC